MTDQPTTAIPGVPDEAVEAAARAVYGEVSGYYLALTRRWLAAAVPHVREAIAREIEAELVCGCIEEAQGGSAWPEARDAGWPVVQAMGVHQICWWSWCSARIARGVSR